MNWRRDDGGGSGDDELKMCKVCTYSSEITTVSIPTLFCFFTDWLSVLCPNDSDSVNGCFISCTPLAHQHTFPSVLWHSSLGDRKGIQSVKSWVLVCWWWQFDWSCARLIAATVTITSFILAPIKSTVKTFWYQLTQVHLENGC